MKVLFVDSSADLQQKWIEPLREKGWGVVRARSREDADRMMLLHRDALQAIVVSEEFVSFAEKNDHLFVVLTKKWNEREIITHQNSDHSAVGYVPYTADAVEIYKIFQSKEPTDGKAQKVKSPTAAPMSLVKGDRSDQTDEYKILLSSPEIAKKGSKSVLTLQLEPPSVFLGGNLAINATAIKAPEIESEPTAELAPMIDVAPLEVQTPEVQTVDFNEPEQSAGNQTLILDSTKLSVDFSDSIFKESEPAAEAQAEAQFEVSDGLDEITSLDDLLSPPPPPPNHQQNQPMMFSTPSQLAINPSPTAGVADVETLKSYLALREQDVAVLSGQVRSSQERIQQLESLLQVERSRGAELAHMVSKQEQTLKNYDHEKQIELEVLKKQIEDLSAQLKERTDKFRAVEAKLRITSEEISKVKDRVRIDVRRIRVREKELENQLEILKKDSSALLQARDEKVLELKRRLDLVEFNMELVQEQYSKERQNADELRTRLKDAATVMKQAGGMLEQ